MKYRALLLLLISSPALAEPLGRLFFTPIERAALERPAKALPSHPTVKPPPVTLQLNGIVQKHGGARTVWVNGRAQQQNEEQVADQATLPVAGKNVQLYVGQHTQVEP